MRKLILSFIIISLTINVLYSSDKTYSHSFGVYSGSIIWFQESPAALSFGVNYEFLPFQKPILGFGLSGEYRGGSDSYGVLSLPLYLHLGENTKLWLAPSLFVGEENLVYITDTQNQRNIEELFVLRIGFSTGFNIDWMYLSPFINIGLPVEKLLFMTGLNFEVRI